jgi:hypothetical protein
MLTSPVSQRRNRVIAVLSLALFGILLLVARAIKKHYMGNVPITSVQPGVRLDTPAQLAIWPWPGAKQDSPHHGVTHWAARSSDGTTTDLLLFDFSKNPKLRLELYSQDEDDEKPFDNVVKFWRLGVGQATRHLQARQYLDGGKIVAAWNGPFFGYYRSAPIPDETAFHVAPIVLRGKVYHNTGNHRWTFGVKYVNGKPVFKTFHLPRRAVLAREFDFAGGGVQCLIKDGKPLKLQPFPKPGEGFLKQPVPSSPQEAGHIPAFDHAKFSRVSLAWSRDNRQLYLLVVREPNSDSEAQSIQALEKRVPNGGGWMVSDLQNFWLAMMKQGKIWNAINSDAGDVAQLAYLQPDDKYMLISPRGDNPNFERRVFPPDFKNTPQGGALMYFYVRDTNPAQTAQGKTP